MAVHATGYLRCYSLSARAQSSLSAAPPVGEAPLEDNVARREDHVGRLAVAWPQEALAATPRGAAQLEDRMAKREDLVGWLATVSPQEALATAAP